ncbi:conserved exported hypothetical protein [Mesorhizobium plurifarium]|uniref:Helix-hairpin-helix domain-containing protein n=1 Tax=Mesorhizobium plurifarium TaxID=69974 RepID=A0A090GUX5_MESPL|nr:conserved exported hypothetical protein [Mesorhizobium plurifarium]
MIDLVRRKLILAAVALIGLTAGSAATAQETLTRLNPNTATEAELAQIGGLPADLAKAIVAARPFARTGDYDAIVSPRLEGDAKTALYEQLFLPIDLNEATEDEIAVIPGMSRRMIHEFEEYRPYTSIEQFNREIGKYVDDDEVARLRSYVTLGE